MDSQNSSKPDPVGRYSAPEGLTARDYLIACVMNLMWGLNLIAVKMGVDLVAPLTAAWLRRLNEGSIVWMCIARLRTLPIRTWDSGLTTTFPNCHPGGTLRKPSQKPKAKIIFW